MRRLMSLTVCLALVAGLFVSCSGNEASRTGNRNAAGNGNSTPSNAAHQDGGESKSKGRADSGDGSGGEAQNGEKSVDPKATDNQSQNEKPGNFKGFEVLEGDILLDGIDLSAVLRSARISGVPGKYVFTFEHPDVPAELHLSVSLKVYEQLSDGDGLVFSYDSDGAWLTRPEDYDPSARTVTQAIVMPGSLEDKYVLAAVRCFETGSSRAESEMAMRDYDGLVTEEFRDIFSWSM